MIELLGLSLLSIDDVSVIPERLIQRLDGCACPVDMVREYIDSPNIQNMVFTDDDDKIRGFLSVSFNVHNDSIYINFMSVDDEYCGNGMTEHIWLLADIFKDTPAKKIFFHTLRPDDFERGGIKRSDQVYMEYEIKDKD
jgi:hypothetical protein|tara:strand:+ start:758 stop:1174 length:417 start_codon:yes stop_codon:yes gene_type:complete